MAKLGTTIQTAILTAFLAVGGVMATPTAAFAADPSDGIIAESVAPAPILDPVPAGWQLAGTNAGEYAVGTSRGDRRGDQASGVLQSTGLNFAGGGTLAQRLDVSAMRGRRVRLSGLIKTEGVQNGAGLLLTIDGTSYGRPVAETRSQPVLGTSDWVACDVTVDIPVEAETITVGLWLDGRGKALLNGMAVAPVVAPSVARTGAPLSFGG